MPAGLAQEEACARLDALIDRLQKSQGTDLLVEHLQTAHADWLGGMSAEAIHNLQMASGEAGKINPSAVRDQVKEEIASIAEALKPATPPRRQPRVTAPAGGAETPPPTAAGVAQFFHGTGETLGIFYPRRHIVGVYASFKDAFYGLEILREAGFHSWEALAVPGDELMKYIHAMRENHSLWTSLMREISHLLDTEAGLTDAYERRAQHGAGFLIAYCPDQADAEEMAGLLEKSKPISLHWFMPAFIRALIS